MSIDAAVSDFITFMQANGVEPTENIAGRLASGSLIRSACEGDSKGRKNGWAILYLDARPAGAFGNHRLNTGTLKWKANSEGPALSPQERAALQAEWQQAKERREAERQTSTEEAARDAAEIWQRAKPAGDHPYVAAKGIAATDLRRDGENLVVPMCDEHGMIWNLQRIKPDGDKRFLHGGRINGLFHLIGEVTAHTREVVLVEGYATGDTVHRAVGLPVVVAFNTANLPRVARLWNDLRPDLHFTIFADDDELTARRYVAEGKPYKNPGIETAKAVAAEIGAAIAYPLGEPCGKAA